MADIELVIKISKDSYNATCNGCMLPPDVANVVNAIRNGTPLPKGHGDLIDRRELKKEVYTTTEWNGDIHRIIYEASIDDAKPIIEVESEE
jgi:hypothetical protein